MDKANGSVSFRRYIFSMFAIILLLNCLIYFLSSCEREGIPDFNGEEPEIPTGELVTVNFTISENGFSPSITPRKGASMETYASGSVLLYPSSGESEKALYMTATLTEDEPPVRLRSTLDQEARVRIIAYTIAGIDTTLVAFADYQALSDGSLTAVGPPITILTGTYMFVAYSFNSADPLPAFTDTTTNIISKDVVWGKKNQSVGIGNSTVSINLAHLFSKITMTVSLDFPDAGLSIDGVTNAHVSSYEEPKLIVRSGRPILDPGAILGSVVFDWDIISGSGNPSAESKPQYIYMNGQTPVTAQINSVIIDNASYPFNGSYAPMTFNTVLQGGHSYTFNVHFERGPSGTADILYVDNDTLKVGRWGVDNFPLDSILFFKFGGVVGFVKPPSGTAWNQNLVKFNPRSATYNNYGSVPGYTQQMYNQNQGRISISDDFHTNRIGNGHGDPCKLVGLKASDVKSWNAAQFLAYNSGWKMSLVDDYINFVRAPAAWLGLTSTTNLLNHSTANYWGTPPNGVIGVVSGGGWFPIPGSRTETGRLQINTNPHGFLPAVGSYNDGTYNANGWGEYWSSELFISQYPYCLRFNSTSVYPISITTTTSNQYPHAMPVRCVKVNP